MVQKYYFYGHIKGMVTYFYGKMNQNKYSDINALAKKYGFIVMLVAVFLIFFAKEIITILADKSYHEALYIIPDYCDSYFFFFCTPCMLTLLFATEN
ncbi:MAG: hypothetical protein U5L09_08915 [Bacteroidales bacterium]|nr:hypothetical protein [Bacteroidales bacterium]